MCKKLMSNDSSFVTFTVKLLDLYIVNHETVFLAKLKLQNNYKVRLFP